MHDPSPSSPPRPFHHQYGALLVLILVSLAFQLAAGDSGAARITVVALQAATLVAAVVIARARPWVIRATATAAFALLAATVATVLGTESFGQDAGRLITLLLVALAPGAIVTGMVKDFRTKGYISIQLMFGVLCIYLLIGLVFASAFGVIQALGDSSFFAHGEGNTSNFLYFSYTTITTTGYGDFVAGTSLGRSLAITEALIGQIYMVSVVALIVSNVGTSPRRRVRE